MDTPLAAAAHKENVHIGGGKATLMTKPDKMKTAGKKRKALADLRSNYVPVAAASKDVANNTKSVMLGKFGKGSTSSDYILTDEEIKQCYEWAKDGIEEMGGYSWSAKAERKLLMNQTLSEIMASTIGVPISELEQPFLSDEEGYETDGSDFNSSISVPGRHSSVYSPEEPDDPLGVAGLVLEEYPLPELKLDDDYGEFSISNDGEIDGEQASFFLEKLGNKTSTNKDVLLGGIQGDSKSKT